MPHEFRNLSSLSHGELGLMLVGGLASAAVIIGLALVLAWKNRRRSAEGNQPQRPKPRKVKRRKRR
jgi:NADH:ubiquinone oxidoreductase subunit K